MLFLCDKVGIVEYQPFDLQFVEDISNFIDVEYYW